MPFNGSTFSFSLFAFFFCGNANRQQCLLAHTHTHTTRRWLWKLVWVVVSVIRRRRRRRRTNASRTWASISEGRTAAHREREGKKEKNWMRTLQDTPGQTHTYTHTHANSVLAIPLKCFELGSITCCLCTVKIAVKKLLERTQVNCLECSLQRLLSLVSAGNAAYAWYSLARF